jgi:hypothetical protein
MARWLVECVDRAPDCSKAGLALPRFRIFPEGEPDRWIAQTNPSLPLQVQEEAALLIADALSKVLGV